MTNNIKTTLTALVKKAESLLKEVTLLEVRTDNLNKEEHQCNSQSKQELSLASRH